MKPCNIVRKLRLQADIAVNLPPPHFYGLLALPVMKYTPGIAWATTYSPIYENPEIAVNKLRTRRERLMILAAILKENTNLRFFLDSTMELLYIDLKKSLHQFHNLHPDALCFRSPWSAFVITVQPPTINYSHCSSTGKINMSKLAVAVSCSFPHEATHNLRSYESTTHSYS